MVNNEKITIFALFLILLCFTECKGSRMGKAKYSKDGAIESGTAKTNCTYPKKRYAKDLDAKVKASIDSLSQYPDASIDLGVKQTVTRLSDYSSEGLDIDLILFRLCEISINKGFSAAQTNSLFAAALDSWSKKNSSK